MGSLAHIAVMIRSLSASVNLVSIFLIVASDKTKSFARLILFSVRVPVLSVQITVALPSVSTVLVCFTITPICIRRHAPSAINVASATGISSGKILIAKVSALSKLSSRSFECW